MWKCTWEMTNSWGLKILGNFNMNMASQVAQWWKIHLPIWQKNPPLFFFWQKKSLCQRILLPMQETWEKPIWSLGQEDTLEWEMSTHFSILAWKIPWAEELGGLSPWGCKESDTTDHKVIHTQEDKGDLSF